MSIRNILRKVLLRFMLGGRSVLGIGMSREQIEELLYSTNQTKVEVTVSKENGKGDTR
jgi:hypothetical protein